MFSGQFYENRLSVRERNMKLLLGTVTYIVIKENVTCIITIETVMCIMHCKNTTCIVTYPDWLHLGVPPPPFRHHVWQKFLNLVPPDALKMHSLAVPVLRFLCKTFSKLRKLNNETLFPVDV